MNERKKEVHRIDGALAALGNLSVNGTRPRRTLSSAGHAKTISLAQKERWAKQKARETQAHDVSRRQKENRGCRTCTLGEVQNGKEESSVGDSGRIAQVVKITFRDAVSLLRKYEEEQTRFLPFAELLRLDCQSNGNDSSLRHGLSYLCI